MHLTVLIVNPCKKLTVEFRSFNALIWTQARKIYSDSGIFTIAALENNISTP
jgi:hypothetical protein